MDIGVIGSLGVVGSAVTYGFRKLGHNVWEQDIKDPHIKDIVPLLVSDITFICVPSPSKEDGSCDTSIVEEVVHDYIRGGYKGIVAIKSTVPPGTTERLIKKYPSAKICHVPEFLRERHSVTDFIENHNLLVIGASHENSLVCNFIFDTVAAAHGNLPKNIMNVRPTEAELIKYMHNCYNATLITFANSFYEICKKTGSNYNTIKSGLIKQNDIKDMYLDVNKSLRGYGGMCLPKDVKAMAHAAKILETNVEFFEHIDKENNKYEVTVFKGMRK